MIILTAALDLVGPTIPKGVVLLSNVIPALVVKLLCPYFIHLLSYSTRILCLVSISVLGMFLVVLTPAYDDADPSQNAVATKMIGVALASSSSAAGEVTFLGLTHFYGPFSLAGWGSGTGGAGLVGAGAYALATTGMGLSSRGTLFASAFLPFVMVGSFFLVLPLEAMKRVNNKRDVLGRDRDDTEGEVAALERHDEIEGDDNEEEDRLLQDSFTSSKPSIQSSTTTPWTATLFRHLRQMRALFFP